MGIQKPEWFRLDPAKFLADRIVDAMSTLELGACLRLLCRQWIDGDLSDDIRILARHSRLSEPEMEQAWSMLSDFFPIVAPGKRANRFMWIERARVSTELERRSDEGTRLARKRWDAARSADGNAVRMPDAMQDQSRPDQTREEKIYTSTPDGVDQSLLLENAKPNNLDQLLQSVWDCYMTQIGKNPKQYEWSDERKRMGMARMRELKRRSGSWENAVALMKLCIDRMKADPWRARGKEGWKHRDWENLFRSNRQMEYWLDDQRWADTKGLAR